MQYREPFGYSTRAEGWACDYYDAYNCIISTGYAPISAKNTKPNYKLIRKNDDAAREIVYGSGEYSAKVAAVDALLYEVIKDAKG